MKNFVSFFVFFIWLLAAAVSCNDAAVKTDAENAQAEIQFETREADLGTLRHGEKAEYVFYFKNSGTDDLIIKEIITNCGCTAADIQKKQYAPGEEGKIKIIFDTRGFFNNQQKTTQVFTNTKDSVVSLQLTAFVDADLKLNTINR